MKNKSLYFNSILSSLFIIALPFQDVNLLHGTFGHLTVNLSSLFVPLMFISLIIYCLFNHVTVRVKYIYLFVLFIIINLVIAIIVNYYYSDYLFSKGINLSILILFMAIPCFFYKVNNLLFIRESIFIALVLSVLGFLFVDVFKLSNFLSGTFFHVTNYNIDYIRPRGFSLESSLLSFTILSLLLAYSSLCNKKKILFFSLFFCFVISILTMSKGAISALCLSITFGLLLRSLRNKNKNKSIILVFLSICALAFLMPYIDNVFNKFLIDINHHTSVATRSVLFLVSVSIGFASIFGVGVWGYIPFGVELIPTVVESLSFYFSLNYSEVMDYYYLFNGDSFSYKNTLSDIFVLFGFVGVFLFFRFFIYSIKNTKKIISYIFFTFSMISLSFYIPFLGIYITLLPIIIYYHRDKYV